MSRVYSPECGERGFSEVHLAPANTFAGAACLTLTNAAGCELLGRTSKLTSLHTPRVSPLRTPKVWPLPSVTPAPPEGVWSFRSRPDLSPAAVEVTIRAKGSSPGYILVALKEGADEHGPMIVDDQGQLVWYSKYRSARDFRVQGPVSGVTDTVSGTVGVATDTVRGATDNLLGGGEKQR